MFNKKNKLAHTGWKLSYKQVTKKAMEQELSWTGLGINLAIAFFIVALSATGLRIAYHSFNHQSDNLLQGKVLIEAGALVKYFIPQAEAATTDTIISPEKDTYYIQVVQGQSVTQTIRFKNISKQTLKASALSFETGPSLRTFSKFKSDVWLSFYKPAKVSSDIKAGQTIAISFPLKAPTNIEGMVQENFQLVKDERPIPGSLVRVFVTIVSVSPTPTPTVTPTNPAPVVTTTTPIVPSTSATAPDPSIVINSNPSTILNAEPIIRVGLYNPTTQQHISYDGVYDVVTSAETLFSGVLGLKTIGVTYDSASRLYAVSFGTVTKTTALPVRFVPRVSSGVATLNDYQNAPAWNPGASDNRFRGVIEYRYTEPANKVWIINELPIETYLKGLAETSNAGVLEYQKVMATVARSYAMYHYLRGISYGLTDASTKHAADHFYVDAYYDQVYRGYNSEIRMPRLAEAVDATRGVVVSYQCKPVVTPYFSNSDGRTRDWTEVWGGAAVPWLKSVVVTADLGQTLYGHGVGLSARAAAVMANAGQSWQTILKYFYSGTDLLKIY